MKIGLVGGYGHESVALVPGADLAWACDGYDDMALVRARARGCEKTYPSMMVMLEEFQPDIVYIGSVYARNGQLAIQAMRRGFNVVSEKPLATTREGLEDLVRITESGDQRIIAEFTMRWLPAFQKVRELVLQGAIGRVGLIHARKTYRFGTNRPDFYKSRQLFGGIIGWVAVHAIDYAAWCTGLRYESVTAVQGNLSHPDYAEMEDHAAMLFTMTGGIPCVVTADFLCPASAGPSNDRPLRITGSAGILEIRNHQVFLTTDEGEQEFTCTPPDSTNRLLAVDLVEAAAGRSTDKITTAECLHITSASVAAKDAAESDANQVFQID